MAAALALALGAAGVSAEESGTATAGGPAPEAVLADLPFLDAPNPLAVFIDLAPEGASRALSLQLDTGAQTTVLTPDFARSLGVNVRRLKAEPYRRETRLGRDLLFYVDTSGGDRSARFARFDYGLLGGQFLARYVLEIDYPARRVRFLDPKRFSVPEEPAGADEVVLPIRVVGARPVVDLQVGGKSLRTLIDTGSPVGLIVGNEESKQLGLEPRPLHGFRMFGVFGEIDTLLAEASGLALGSFRFDHHPVVVAPRGLQQQGTSNDSVIGHDLLSLFVVRIDYPNRRLWLKRAGPLEPRLLGAAWNDVRRSGCLLQRRDGRIWVRSVQEAGPAQKLGLAPNDVVEFVNAQPPGGLASVHTAIAEAEVPLRILRAEEGRWTPRTLHPPSGDGP